VLTVRCIPAALLGVNLLVDNRPRNAFFGNWLAESGFIDLAEGAASSLEGTGRKEKCTVELP